MMNPSNTPLNRYGIFRKTGLFLFFGVVVLGTFFGGFLVPLLWIGTFLALGVMGMCLGYVATGQCPVCNEHLQVHKKRGGTRCRACGASLMIQDGRLWSLQSSSVNTPAASQSSQGPPARKPLLTRGYLMGIGICVLLFLLARFAADRPPADKQPDAGVGLEPATQIAGQDAESKSVESPAEKQVAGPQPARDPPARQPAADNKPTIPGLSAADVYAVFTEQGFALSTEAFPEEVDSGIRMPPSTLWECGKRGGGPLEPKVQIFGYSDSEIMNIRGFYFGTSSDARVIRRESRRLLEDVAAIEYTGSRPEEAKQWVRENVGQNAKTVIGPVSFELIAAAPRVRTLIIQPVSPHDAPLPGENGTNNRSVEPDPARLDELAAEKLRLAKKLLEKNGAAGRRWLQEVIDKYPDTDAAQEASMLLQGE